MDEHRNLAKEIALLATEVDSLAKARALADAERDRELKRRAKAEAEAANLPIRRRTRSRSAAFMPRGCWRRTVRCPSRCRA